MKNKIGLLILDGWGIGKKDDSDAISKAQTPFFDSLLKKYSNAQLTTFGEAVGLPAGQMGNSEVGHLNIGAGRIVYQELSRINNSVKSKAFFKNPVLLEAFKVAREQNKKMHFIGLVSNGGVHSHQKHLEALCTMANEQNITNTYIHVFTDGRDCDPKSGLGFVKELEDFISTTTVKIASVIGRYFAMDRDNRWERIKKAYHLMTKGQGAKFNSASEALSASYKNGITDEFVDPVIINNDGIIETGDVVICFNFRSDRPREITTALTQKDFPEFGMKKLDLHYYCMTRYDESFKHVKIVFEKENLANTLGEVISKHGLSQVRIAETEKYPHVTFFFNGGREAPFEKEHRILVNSPKVATYDLMPEMSAHIVKSKIIDYLTTENPDFICLNFANPDMVGHTGVFPSIVKAVETVDHCLEEIITIGKKTGYEFIVIADHGNADMAINADRSPNTAHTTNPVPVVFVSEKDVKITSGKLADIAPTILKRLGIECPDEMNGESLII
ncbi:MAG: 2,3-bisphosphoglycerate-independent phosphoglycerate mutase [Crocinitomicaceae bacterium]